MTPRFSTVAGFLAAASLLSGSAFAFAPEFTDDLPTVIITDRLTQATVSGSDLLPYDDPDGVGGIGSLPPAVASAPAGRESSVFLFRYEDALDLTTFIDQKDAATFADVKVVFNEFLNTGTTSPVAQGVRTLEINDRRSIGNIAPTKSDFSGPGAFNADEPLTFRNVDFSDPANALVANIEVYDEIGDVTTENIVLSGSQERIVTFNIDSLDSTDPAPGTRGLASMLVITTTDGVDRLTNPVISGKIVSVVPPTSSFGGTWQVDLSDNGILGIANNGDINSPSDGDVPPAANMAGFVTDPAGVAVTEDAFGGVAPANTNQVGMSSTAAQTGFSGWALLATNGGTVDLTADSVYRLRMTMAGQAAQPNNLFFSFGTPFDTGKHYTAFLKNAVDGSSRVAPKLGSADQIVDIWAPARATGPGEVNLLIIDDSTSGGGAFTLKEFQIDSAPRADLDTVQTVFNFGAASLSADAAELAKAPLPGSPVPFELADLGSDPADGSKWIGAGLNGANGAGQTPQTFTFNASGAALFYNAGSTFQDVWQMAQFANAFVGVDDIDTGYDLDPNALYVFDVWLKAQTAGVQMPNLAILAISDTTLQSTAVFGIGDLGPGIDNAAVQAQTTDRVYSMAFNPATGNAEAKTTFIITFLATVHTGFGVELPTNTLTVSRAVLTEYLLPQ